MRCLTRRRSEDALLACRPGGGWTPASLTWTFDQDPDCLSVEPPNSPGAGRPQDSLVVNCGQEAAPLRVLSETCALT